MAGVVCVRSHAGLSALPPLSRTGKRWPEDGNVKVKAASQIPDHALQAIKNIRVKREKDGSQTLDVELYDKVGVLRLLAKASGLLDNPDDGEDKPSVIGINVQAPEPIDVEVKDEPERPD